MQSSTQPGDSNSANFTCSESNTQKSPGIFNRRKHIENKISDGDLKGASRLLFSSESLSPDNPDTLQALQTKHPPAPSTPYSLDPPTASQVCLQINSKETLEAIISFKTGSAAGLDGISPQHLKDLISHSSGDAGIQLLNSITKLINKMYTGNINPDIVPILFGANLIALNKKDGGVRPIAVGTTLRRLASKIAVRHIISKLKPLFEPIQLGFGTKGGCEAAVHSLRTYLSNTTSEVLIKIDVKNSVNRDTLLTETKHNIPEIYNYLLLSYADPTKLLYRENVLSSEVGCQQGDPLGPAIFSLAINPIIKKLNSKFNVWYLDDGTLGGDVDTVTSDLSTIKTEFRNIGLEINFSKCELYIPNSIPNHNNIEENFNTLTPNIKVVNSESLCLLGSPIFEDSFPNFIENSISKFKKYSNRLLEISPHYAITILKFCLFVPKLTYAIRCSPIWKFGNIILPLDDLIKSTLESILNIQLSDHSWTQASLPIRHGGLGIRKISSVALPAFLSSVHSSASLIGKILKGLPSNYETAGLDEAKKAWSTACPSKDFPTHPNCQRSWDDIMCQISVDSLLNRSTGRERARLLASASKESGEWLRAYSSPNTGTFLTPDTLRIATCLRLGVRVCAPHRCPCGSEVDELGHHGLSCQKSAGRFSRHAALNDIIRRSLASVNVPALLEPTGIARDDGKRPDGMSLVPWGLGRVLVWDATCVDTLAPSHLTGTSNQAGAAAKAAEKLKMHKYRGLGPEYIFMPFGVETLGPWGPSALQLFKELAKRLIDLTGDRRAGSFLAQRISLAIQRGNAASVFGTMPKGSNFLDLF
ncbi:uncharacterized protein LOC134656640 [Cydia amplana]|uniref:uncharacterized protein LOC134656640 n=1 Tax=Cydia amplana TaxID=1869771 RepID=UPI002FE51903